MSALIQCYVKLVTADKKPVSYTGIFKSAFDAWDDADAKFPGAIRICTGPAP